MRVHVAIRRWRIGRGRGRHGNLALLSVTRRIVSLVGGHRCSVDFSDLAGGRLGSRHDFLLRSSQLRSGTHMDTHPRRRRQSYAVTQSRGTRSIGSHVSGVAGLVNGASFRTGMAPGMITTIFGVHLSNASGIVARDDSAAAKNTAVATKWERLVSGRRDICRADVQHRRYQRHGTNQLSDRLGNLATQSTSSVVVTNNSHGIGGPCRSRW